jgi:monoterpene epsilon-lactone hydrolase
MINAKGLLLKSALRFMKRRSRKDPDVKLARTFAHMGLALKAPPSHIKMREPHGQYIQGEWLYSESSSPGRVILYLHGGGYFFCSPKTHRAITADLADLTQSNVLALRYRLAPEHPYPAALEDAVKAYRWLLEMGYSPNAISIAGDSAGGGLALALLVYLKDHHIPQPCSCVCFSPWTDLAVTGLSLDHNDHRCLMFSGEGIRRARMLYLGKADPYNPWISPLYADLSGLPPLLIHVSDNEVLLDDSTRLAEKARRSGVDVELKIWQDLPHVWQLFKLSLPESTQSLKLASSFILRHLKDKS